MSDATLMLVGLGLLATLSVGGLLAAVFYPQLSGRSKTNKRMASVAGNRATGRGARDSQADTAQQRRKQVQETLKDLEQQQKTKKKRIRLQTRIHRAGLTFSKNVFLIGSLIFGLLVTGILFITGSSALVSLGAGFVAGLGLPRWFLSFKTKRRQAKFLDEFANAIDVVVRGIKAGLPVTDCMRIIANESPPPVGPEFEEIVEGQKLGIPLDQGLERMYERMPLAEVNFLAIVISIQQQTGGNLAEALANLSHVLRDRKKLQGKILAMSQEAKSSAAIIGALPIAVMGLMYMTSPDYISLLWTEKMGHVMLMISAFWMMCGVLVMRKMINFDY